jgi:histidine triad (HIT) family protein
MSTTAEPSLFTRIVAREIPADIVFENERIIAFRDIAPKAPVHLLVVPKTAEFANVTELAAADPALLAEVVAVAQHLADEHCDGHYRLVFNTGRTDHLPRTRPPSRWNPHRRNPWPVAISQHRLPKSGPHSMSSSVSMGSRWCDCSARRIGC